VELGLEQYNVELSLLLDNLAISKTS
jgi:hypothetical protein